MSHRSTRIAVGFLTVGLVLLFLVNWAGDIYPDSALVVPIRMHNFMLCLLLMAAMVVVQSLGRAVQLRATAKLLFEIRRVGEGVRNLDDRMSSLERQFQEQAEAQSVGAKFQGYIAGMMDGATDRHEGF